MLIPTPCQAGLSVVGGLSANFHDPASSVTSWLSSGLKMVQGMSGVLVEFTASLTLVLHQ